MVQQKKSSTICIVQITRIGDLLQTEMVASYMKKAIPSLNITLVARKQFATPIIDRLNKTFTKCHLIDPEEIFTSGDQTTLTDATTSLEKIVSNISASNIDVCINLSFSRTSSYLCSLIKAKHKLGPWYGKDGTVIISDKWSKHIYASVMRGTLNPYSLVDIYSSIIGAPFILDQQKSATRKKQIVIHPFSSETKKTWGTIKWTDLIYTIIKQNPMWKIVIVGAKNDMTQASAILNSPLIQKVKDNILNLTGSSEISDIEKIMRESALFIGNDSMVGHIASTTGTQSITLSLGPVRPIETVPYGKNNIVVTPKINCFPCEINEKCPLLGCHSKIHYQAITAIAQNAIQNQDVTLETILKYTPSCNLDGIRIYKSSITLQNKLSLVELTKNESEVAHILTTMYRICWNFFFDEIEENLPFPSLNAKTASELKHYASGLQHLYDLCEFGKKYSRYILEDITCTPPKIDQIKKHSANIDEIDNLQEIVRKSFPLLAPIIDYFQVCKSNLPGGTLVAITENSYITFNDYATVIAIMYELIEKILTQYDIKNNTKFSTTNAGVTV